MKCISCGAALPEGANFCPGCGARQGFPTSPPPPPLEPEAPVWKGGYSMRNDGFAWLLWILYAAAAVVIAFKWLSLNEAWLRWVYAGAVLLPAVILFAGSVIRRFSIRYRLTTHRLFKEVGIVSRRTTEIELLRVDDLSVSQNVVQRIFNVGLITLSTTDTSDPKLEMKGIQDPVEVKEAIRTHVQKRRGRTVNLESL